MTITNDGATILKQMQVLHPAAKMVRLKMRALGICSQVSALSSTIVVAFFVEMLNYCSNIWQGTVILSDNSNFPF